MIDTTGGVIRGSKLFAPDGDPRRNADLDWLDEYTPTAMAEAFKIAEMSGLDPDGQGFRYYRDLKGNRNLQAAPRAVNLDHLRGRMTEIFEFLLGCSLGADELIEAQQYADE